MKISYVGKTTFCYKQLANKIFIALLSEQSLENNFSVCISFVDEKEIQELNKKFRQVDKSTDVLSFPEIDFSQKLTTLDLDEEGNYFLGDIVICKPFAILQAKKLGHSKRRELAFLTLHGLLHLCGYDHIELEDEKLMISKQNKILEKLKIER